MKDAVQAYAALLIEMILAVGFRDGDGRQAVLAVANKRALLAGP